MNLTTKEEKFKEMSSFNSIQEYIKAIDFENFLSSQFDFYYEISSQKKLDLIRGLIKGQLGNLKLGDLS